jgi:hypothetical protein
MADIINLKNNKRNSAPVDSILVTFDMREKMDEDRISEFVDLLNAGHVLDPIIITIDDGVLYLIDGKYRIEAHKRAGIPEIEYDIVEEQRKHWILLAAKLNSGCALPLKKGELKKIIIRAYKDGSKPKEIYKYLQNRCSWSWVRKTLAPYIRRVKEEKKKKVINLKKEGLKLSEIEKETGVNMKTAQRYIAQELNHGPLDSDCDKSKADIEEDSEPHIQKDKDMAWIALKKSFDKIHEWKPNDEATLFCIYKINAGELITRICKIIDYPEVTIRYIAVAMLFLYNYEDITTEDLSDKLPGISESQLTFIAWIMAHFPKVVPDRKSLFEWIQSNNHPYSDNDHARNLIRKEKLYWHFKARGETAPWEQKASKEYFREKDIPGDFGKIADLMIECLMDLQSSSRSKEMTKRAAQIIMEPCNRIMIAINSLMQTLRKAV